jgi:5-methylcytosine-specific restriction endonuclease McrA
MIRKYKDHIRVEGSSALFNKKSGFENIDYNSLIELYKNDNYIPYAEYLRTNLWKTKRLEILDRDGFLCQNCSACDTVLRQDKAGEIVVEWSDVLEIYWTDTSGQKRISSLFKPQGQPERPYNLQVHHKRYVVNRLPWNYDNKDLITLCNYCHTEEHKANNILVYDEFGKALGDQPDCNRCAGTGYMPEYRHVQNGICFKCGGSGFDIKLMTKKVE